MRLMRVIDVIPKDHSDEITNDTETNIAVNPSNPAEIVVTAFSQEDPANTNSPFFYSQDGGENWSKEYDIAAGATVASPFITNDWTVSYASTSNFLYTAVLRADNEALNVFRGSDPSNATTFTLLPNPTSDGPDQPWVAAITATQGPHAGKDCIYIGYNSSAKQAKILMCFDTTASPAPFVSPVTLESRSGRQNEPAVRPVVHPDGTVYAAFMSIHAGNPPTDVVVVRDDNWGSNGFADLKDPNDNSSGRIAATISEATTEGHERGRTGLDIQVDPTNSDIVYLCYIDNSTTNNTVNIRRSLNRGVDWSGSLLTVSDTVLSELAINNKGTVALMLEKYIAPPADRWETHFRSTEDGTNWDDTLVASTPNTLLPAGVEFTLGDYMRLVAVGPHFYGAFPATNTPGPANFFPDGGGTTKFLRNVAADGVTLLKNDDVTPLGKPTVDPFFLKVEQRDIIIQLERNPLSQDEVDARRASGQLPFKGAFRVLVDGYTANELGVHGPNDVLNVPSPGAGMTVTCTGNIPDTGAWGMAVQRFTFMYDIGFTDDSPFNFGGDSHDVTLEVTAGNPLIQASASAFLTLIKSPDPFILHGDPSWLSVDLRVFAVQSGQQFFSGHPWQVSDAAGCPKYIQTVATFITTDDFENELSTSEDNSRLYTQRTDGLGHEVFNFALAKVHYIGQNPQPFDVRVFFRLFQAQTTTGQYDFTPGMSPTQPAQYRRGVNGDGQPIPLAGFQGGEFVTIPFFATQRVDSEVRSMTEQTDLPNLRKITPRADGGEVIQFFGCWLDFNQPTRPDPSSGLVVQNNVLPVHVPTNNFDGPFTTGAVPIQSLVRATHSCLIAEIDFSPTPIPVGKDPGNWDKLAQRNITYSDAGSATAVTTFDIKPTILQPLPADQSPDELVIDWGRTRADRRAQIYLPKVQVSDILTMASHMYYPANNLSRIDDHTIGCRVGGITYIPIPPATGVLTVGANYAGLISIEMPDTLHKGEVFDIVVRQVSNRSAPRPIVPKILKPPARQQQHPITNTGLAAPDPDTVVWRQTAGAFQLSIPVGDKSILLPRESNDLAALLYIAQSIPQTSRWYPVFKRYLSIVAGRVSAFGGDPNTILPSATGVPRDCEGNEGEGQGEGMCCPCCEQQHHPGCRRFKPCGRHPGFGLHWRFGHAEGWLTGGL